MFTLVCPVDGCTVLRWPGDVISIDHPCAGEIDVLLRCSCSALALLRTGSARGGRDEVVHGAPMATAPTPPALAS
jgi:hypothetical protein